MRSRKIPIKSCRYYWLARAQIFPTEVLRMSSPLRRPFHEVLDSVTDEILRAGGVPAAVGERPTSGKKKRRPNYLPIRCQFQFNKDT